MTVTADARMRIVILAEFVSLLEYFEQHLQKLLINSIGVSKFHPVITKSVLEDTNKELVKNIAAEVVKMLQPSFKELKIKIYVISVANQFLEDRIKSLEEHKASHEVRLTTLEERPALSTQTLVDSTVARNIAVEASYEAKDQALRACNIIAFNISERISQADKLVNFNSILSKIGIASKAKDVFRLGQQRREATRPLKVVFSNPTDALTVLKRRRDFYRFNVQIRDDQTPAQISYKRSLNEELDRRVRGAKRI